LHHFHGNFHDRNAFEGISIFPEGGNNFYRFVNVSGLTGRDAAGCRENCQRAEEWKNHPYWGLMHSDYRLSTNWPVLFLFSRKWREENLDFFTIFYVSCTILSDSQENKPKPYSSLRDAVFPIENL